MVNKSSAHPKGIPRQERAAPEEVIAARRDHLEQCRTITAFLMKLCCVIVAAWVLTGAVFGLSAMKGEGMYPRIRDGDLLLYYRLERKYSIGDVWTFRQNGVRYVGRVVARGGDTVEFSEAGELLVNGNVQSEEIFYPTEVSAEGISFPCEVPEGSVFLLGDLRTGATDSRVYGPVAASDLGGKVITVIRRRGI